MLTADTIRQPAPPGPEDRFVLLVDDHVQSLMALRKVVELAGHTCFATASPSEALRWCGERKPSLVVTDLAMPELDGHDLGLSIQERYPGVPMLLVTGELLGPVELGQLGDTFTVVMSKPIQVPQFLELLDSLIPPACP